MIFTIWFYGIFVIPVVFAILNRYFSFVSKEDFERDFGDDIFVLLLLLLIFWPLIGGVLIIVVILAGLYSFAFPSKKNKSKKINPTCTKMNILMRLLILWSWIGIIITFVSLLRGFNLVHSFKEIPSTKKRILFSLFILLLIGPLAWSIGILIVILFFILEFIIFTAANCVEKYLIKTME